MRNTGWFSRLSNQQPATAMIQRIAGGVGVAVLLMMTGIAAAQNPTAQVATPDSQMSIPDGYSAHGTVDLGEHMSGLTGSKAMYDTLVNIQSGPRVLGETFELHPLPGNKNPMFDSLSAIGTGFGGDPDSYNKLDFHKGKLYEFSGMFRRDRDYFDYDLLGNPNIPAGQSILIGTTAAPAGSLPWPQVNQSPVMFNTVRRMTDTYLTLLPLSKVTIRGGYSQNTMEGPSLSPSGYQFATGDAILSEFQRNSTDNFTGAIDWKPIEGTKLTFEEEIDHFKADSYFTLAPSDFIVQEGDGTKVALNNFDSLTPLKDTCDTFALGTGAVLSPAQPGGLPVISPFCNAVSSYLRTQPTRTFFPTETFRLQSTSIKSISMNGDFHYTQANMSLRNYSDSYQGLSETAVKGPPAGYYGVRSATYTGVASAKRDVVAADYGVTWQATKTFSLSDQFDFSNVHQPGTTTMTSLTTLTTPTDYATSFGNAGINYTGTLNTVIAAANTATFEGSGNVGIASPDYFGQKFLTNNVTATWDATSRATLSATYRYGTHSIVQGASSGPASSVITINEDGGIFNVALRPANNWDVNGTAEILYFDNAFTPVGPRQSRHYRAHTMYKPRPWATLSGAFNDLERHNNTNNNQAVVALFTLPSATPAPNGTASTGTPFEGPLQHEDHSRVYSLGAVLAPNEHYGLDFDYAYSDVYASTNICYLNGATATVPGAVQSATSTVCPYVYGRGATGITEVNDSALSDWFGRDFSDAPTQSGSVAVALSPIDKLHSNIGYRISSVNGTRFFNDARDVNGSLVSAYQTPFVNLAWTVHTGLVLKAEYNYFNYGEGGPSGSQYCSTSTGYAVTAGQTTPGTPPTVVPCTSLTAPTGLTESPAGATAPRDFHANNLTFGIHFAF
jgi:hypothetical protein